MQTLRIRHADDFAEFSPHGGQLLHWQALGRERLFMSPNAVLDGQAASRGGVPVIFPQFSARGPYGRHGFARTHTWQVAEHTGDRLRLQLGDSATTHALWPHRFALHLIATIEPGALTLDLSVENPGAEAFEFSCALHGYFNCRPAATRLIGLAECTYEEHGHLHEPTPRHDLQPEPPLDRIYRGPAAEVRIEDTDSALALQVEGFSDWVVWNPGRDGAAALPDLGGEAADAFLCVEPACIFEPIRLEAGERWAGRLRMRALR